jgi:uncharacterized protein
MNHPANIVYYHKGCMDGLGAAYAVWRELGDEDTVYIPVAYTDAIATTPRPPCVITFVDFCPSLEVLEQLLALQGVSRVQIIDHHISAQRTLDSLTHPKLLKIFDTTKSGATLAWETLHGGEPPWLLRHIEDRDLWKFQFEESRPLHAALSGRDWSFEQLHGLVNGGQGALARLSVIGRALLTKHDRDVRDVLASNARVVRIFGKDIPVCNAPFTMASDIGHELLQVTPDADYAATYWDTAEHRTFSLRSTVNGADVSMIASRFGGGGHARAAGFSVPRTHPLAQV